MPGHTQYSHSWSRDGLLSAPTFSIEDVNVCWIDPSVVQLNLSEKKKYPVLHYSASIDCTCHVMSVAAVLSWMDMHLCYKTLCISITWSGKPPDLGSKGHWGHFHIEHLMEALSFITFWINSILYCSLYTVAVVGLGKLLLFNTIRERLFSSRYVCDLWCCGNVS